MPEDFEYVPLKDPRFEIRLVSLVPDSADTIACKLEHAHVNDGRTYIALSYAWSPPEPQGEPHPGKRYILINSKRASINHNLWLFLSTVQSLTLFAPNTLFWIDQICIDQSTAEQEAPGSTNEASEKSVQVSEMGSIYRRASEVLVWLGKAPSNSEIAVSYIQKAGATAEVLEVDLKEYDALDCLFDNYYWKRRWVIQELYNAASVRFLYGTRCFNRSELRHIIRNQMDPNEALLKRGSGFELPSSTRRLLERDRNVVPPQDNILDLMQEFRESECQSPHDRLYALLGMTTSDVPIDYGQTIEYTLLDLLKYARKKEHAGGFSADDLINSSITIAGLLGIELDREDHDIMAKIAQDNATESDLQHGAGSHNENFGLLCWEHSQR